MMPPRNVRQKELPVVITETRVKLVEENNERLLAFCSVTLDNAFVIRDLKVIEGTRGVFVAMPSRKLTDRCRCGCKNHLKARFCNNCGSKLDEHRALRDMDGRAKLHADIAHPIHAGCREAMQTAIVKAFQTERDLAKQPGYICRYDDFDGGDYDNPTVNFEAAKSGFRPHAGHAPRPSHIGQVEEAPVTLPFRKSA